MPSPCARNRHNILPLGEHPGERELRRLHALPDGDLLHAAEKFEVPDEIIALKAGIGAAPVIRGQNLNALDLAGQESATERTVGNKSDSEFATDGEDLIFGISGPQ